MFGRPPAPSGGEHPGNNDSDVFGQQGPCQEDKRQPAAAGMKMTQFILMFVWEDPQAQRVGRDASCPSPRSLPRPGGAEGNWRRPGRDTVVLVFGCGLYLKGATFDWMVFLQGLSSRGSGSSAGGAQDETEAVLIALVWCWEMCPSLWASPTPKVLRGGCGCGWRGAAMQRPLLRPEGRTEMQGAGTGAALTS